MAATVGLAAALLVLGAASAPGQTSVCELEPAELDFGEVARGQTATLIFQIHNRGTGPLLAGASEGCGPFRVVGGPIGPLLLPPGLSLAVAVSFTPTDTLPAACALDLGTSCAEMPCRGRGIDQFFTPISINFGQQAVGRPREVVFRLRNGPPSGYVPSTCGEAFTVTYGEGPFITASGHEVEVRFQPREPRAYACDLLCGAGWPPIHLDGVGVVDTTGDKLGIYFDPEGVSNALEVCDDMVPAYLVIRDPSGPGGVAGWEARIEWDPPDAISLASAHLLGPDPWGICEAPDFQVGFHQPVPYQPSLAVARLDLFVFAPCEPVSFFVRPLSFAPSIAGTACYAAGEDPGMLIPLSPVSGSQDLAVALMNWGPGTPVAGGAPEARLQAGGGVSLAWRFDPTLGDECHVARRVDGGDERRLTSTALPVQDGRAEFFDPALGLASGARLTYVFLLVRGGAEVARSSEIALTYDAAPPARTALVGCRPNPFNPQTTVTFELSRPGQALLEVYDATGRLVAVLADEPLAAGRYERQWQGRDRSGRPAPSGIYYARLRAGMEVSTSKLTLLK